MRIYADLHIHSHFSIGTSRGMNLPALLMSCRQKGLHVIGSGDALHPLWRSTCRSYENGNNEVILLPTVEVEDAFRIHHLVMMKSYDDCEQFAELLSPLSRNLLTTGRPRVAAGGEKIAAIVHYLGGMIGPAHAFTPWTSLYARYNHLAECYGSQQVDFLELGLSADTTFGNRIPELNGIPFLSNSDAHSPDLTRFGREWNCLDIPTLSAKRVFESIRRGAVIYNAGFYPEEGKYNRTACSRCYRQYRQEEAERNRWRCPFDRGILKKGVADRAMELADGPAQIRPAYYHMIPLLEIIRNVRGLSSPHARKCRDLHQQFLSSLGTEIEILIERNNAELQEIDGQVADAIAALRSGEICLQPGGGGRYGTFSFQKRKGYCSHPSH